MDVLPDPFDMRPFRVRDAIATGVPVDRLRRRDVRSDVYGTRTPAHLPQDLETTARALASRLRSDQFLSHLTAARLWGMRLPWLRPGEPMHVTSVLPGRATRLRGVIGHHIDPPGFEIVEHRGFLLPTPAETWRSLGSILGRDELVIAADGLLSRNSPMATRGQLLRALARNAGRRGNSALRGAFDDVREGTDSARETTLRLDVARAGLPNPEVNGILTRPGEPVRYGDLVFRPWRVVAEYGGVHHQQDRLAYLSDIERFGMLGSEWSFVRVTKEDGRSGAVRRIESALRAAGWHP